nr:hypothetical protein [Plantibacter sp. M259]
MAWLEPILATERSSGSGESTATSAIPASRQASTTSAAMGVVTTIMPIAPRDATPSTKLRSSATSSPVASVEPKPEPGDSTRVTRSTSDRCAAATMPSRTRRE